MTSLAGQTLPHCRITATLGAGGIGEVYRATDTKLGRDVALKVLPAEMASNPERLERSPREARALDAAHEKRVVHRDLKPAIVMLTQGVWIVGVVAAIGLAAACGGSGSPTAPPPPAPMTQAFLQGFGQWSWGNCFGDLGCYFQTSIQNVGPGCASGTSVVVRFYDVNNSPLGFETRMGVSPPGVLSALTIRPNEIVAVSSLSLQDPFASYRVFPTWNNVACP